jgi:hypothetical protein
MVIPTICTIAGVICGLLGMCYRHEFSFERIESIFLHLIYIIIGIGGGIIIGPILMEMGVHPQIASATSSTTMVVTATAAVAQVMTHLHTLP